MSSENQYGIRRAAVLIVFLSVLLMGMPSGVFLSGGLVLQGGPSKGAAAGASTAEILAAESSLQKGSGPARGVPLSCSTQGADGLSCGTTAPPRPSVPAASPGWLDVVPPAQTSPPGGEHPGLVNDSKDGYVLYATGSQNWKFQAGKWTRLSPTVTTVNGIMMAIAYDAADGYVLSFGGYRVDNKVINGTDWSNETWTYAGGTWTNLTPSIKVSPSVRLDAQMAYDAADGYVLLFGGETNPGYAGDTWTYKAGVWTKLNPTLAPSVRAGAGMTYDPILHHVLLFGGYACSSSCGANSETWEYAGGIWTQLSPSTVPPARSYTSLVYDAKDGYDVLMGGQSAQPFMNDTWVYSGGNWHSVASKSNPWPRYEVTMTYDDTDHEVVLCGGIGYYTYQDTWSFATGAWTNIATYPTTSPTPRIGGNMVWDGADGYVLFTGGNGWPGNDTWKFQGGKWTELFPVVAPPVRFWGAMAYDAADKYVLYFGGLDPTGSYHADTWKYVAGIWTNLTGTAGSAPAPRGFAAISFDNADNYVVLWGGASHVAYYTDTWDFVGGHWTQLSPTLSPPARSYPAMTNDSADNYVLLYGGSNANGWSLNDLWKFVGGQWTNLTGTATGIPAVGGVGAMAYDSSASDVVLWALTTYTYHAMAWSSLTLSPNPSFRIWPMSAQDPTDQGVVLFGGMSELNATRGTYLDDTWIYQTIPTTTPQANATAAPTSGQAPLSVGFTGSVSGGSSPYSYAWTFGDGGTSAAQNPSHTYNGSGSYLATLTVTDNAGKTSASSLSITVGGPLAAGIIPSPPSGVVPLNVTFSPGVSGGSSPYTYNWTFGDGSKGSTAANPLHEYNTTGKFPVRLIVKDKTGKNVTAWTNVTVTLPVPLGASLTASPPSGNVPLPVSFTGTGSGGAGSYTYAWVYGDSSAGSTAQDPSHTYNTTGNFTVHLTVADAKGARASAWTNISVSAGPPPSITSFTVSPTSVSLGNPVTFTVSVTGGSGTLTYTYSSLPPGCTSSSVSFLTCTPTVQGSYTVQVSVVDALGRSTSSTTSLTVTPPHPSVSSIVASPAMVYPNQTVTITVTAASGAPPYTYAYTFVSNNGPTNCTSTNAATVTCQPWYVGVYTVTVKVTDTLGLTGWGNATWQVEPHPPVVTSFTANPRYVLASHSVTLQATVIDGVLNSYSYSGLPGGCTNINALNLTCQPTTTGTFDVTLLVTDLVGQVGTGNTTLVVVSSSGGPEVTSFVATPASIVLGASTNLSAVVMGGVGTLTYTYTGLPAGCTSVNSSSLNCTPTATGSFQVTVVVTDATGRSGNGVVTLVVSPPPTVAPTLLGLPTMEAYEIIGLAVVVAIALAVALVLGGKRRKRVAEEQQQAYYEPPQGQGAWGAPPYGQQAPPYEQDPSQYQQGPPPGY